MKEVQLAWNWKTLPYFVCSGQKLQDTKVDNEKCKKTDAAAKKLSKSQKKKELANKNAGLVWGMTQRL